MITPYVRVYRIWERMCAQDGDVLVYVLGEQSATFSRLNDKHSTQIRNETLTHTHTQIYVSSSTCSYADESIFSQPKKK